MSDKREVRQLTGDTEIARVIAAMTDVRSRTLRQVARFGDADVERGAPNTISSVLYHIAAIEADYLFDEILGDLDAMPMHLFPHDVREEGGVLTPVVMPLAEHLDRLSTVRAMLEEHMASFDAVVFHVPVVRAAYDMSPAYALHHLMQHEAEHRAEIGRALLL